MFFLSLTEARAKIKGPRELHVHEGSKLKLHCIVEQAIDPPSFMFWFHNATMVNFDTTRPLKVQQHHYSSSLHITNVSKSDAGSYRCEPEYAVADNVTLHVITGESLAKQKLVNALLICKYG